MRRHLSTILAFAAMPCAAHAEGVAQPPPITTGAFVAKCQADLQYCTKSIIDGQDMDLVMSTLGLPRAYCVPVDLEPKERTVPVMTYIAAHPDLESKPAYQALEEAETSLLPCKR